MRHKTGCALCLLALTASLGSCRSTQRFERFQNAETCFDSLRVNSRFALQADSFSNTTIIYFDSIAWGNQPIDTGRQRGRVPQFTARRAVVITQTTQTAKAQALRKDSTRAAMHQRETHAQKEKEREAKPPALWGCFAALLIIIGIALWRYRK